jgi:hypothetical protein
VIVIHKDSLDVDLEIVPELEAREPIRLIETEGHFDAVVVKDIYITPDVDF